MLGEGGEIRDTVSSDNPTSEHWDWDSWGRTPAGQTLNNNKHEKEEVLGTELKQIVFHEGMIVLK